MVDDIKRTGNAENIIAFAPIGYTVSKIRQTFIVNAKLEVAKSCEYSYFLG